MQHRLRSAGRVRSAATVHIGRQCGEGALQAADTLASCFSGGRSISTNVVSVKPAMMADCVQMAEKFWLKSLSSFSRSSMERCFTLLCSRSLSAASIRSTLGARIVV